MSLIALPTKQVGALEGRVILVNGAQGGLGSAAAEACAAAGATLYRVPVMPSLDGNTVELQGEQVAFSENAVGYSATLEFIRGRVDTVTRALRGD